jgi:hypothetical protein
MNEYVMDILAPVSHTLKATDLKAAGEWAKALLNKGETLVAVKPLELWQEHERIKAQGGRPDVSK